MERYKELKSQAEDLMRKAEACRDRRAASANSWIRPAAHKILVIHINNS